MINIVTVIVSKNKCAQCDMTKRLMDDKGIKYTVKTSDDTLTAKEQALAIKYKNAPVVVADNDDWSGFKPDKIRQLKNGKEDNK